MPNDDVYPNMPPKELERYFNSEEPWYPNHGSDVYEQPLPVPPGP